MKGSPHGFAALNPYFTVKDADAFIAFLSVVFDAEVIRNNRYEDGSVQHARLKINDSLIMLNQANDTYAPMQMQMHIYIEDVDSTFKTAISEGATSVMEPMPRPHGDKMAGFYDPMGNTWWIAEAFG